MTYILVGLKTQFLLHVPWGFVDAKILVLPFDATFGLKKTFGVKIHHLAKRGMEATQNSYITS
jgi:hypothetical protein